VLDKAAKNASNIRNILLALAGLGTVSTAINNFFSDIVEFIRAYPTESAIVSFTLLASGILVTQIYMYSREKKLLKNLTLQDVKTSSEMEQLGISMMDLFMENRVAHIKAEVDRLYNRHNESPLLTENTSAYLKDLEKDRKKYNINSFTERRLTLLLNKRVED
jgi:hypothetical protein